MALVINGLSGIIFPSGAVNAPIIRGDDPDTGFYFPASGQLGIAVNGNNQVTFASGGITFNGNVVLSSPSVFPSGFTSSGTTSFASGFTSAGDITLNAQADLRLADSDSSNWVAFQAPTVVASNITWTLPGTDGSSGTFLSTNGAGTLSWTGVTVPVTSVGGQTGVVTYANTWGIGTNATATTNTTLDVAGAYAQTVISLGTGTSINCSSGNYFTATVSGSPTYTVTGVPSGRSYAFTMEVLHTSGTITWFSGLEWPGGTAPTLTTGKTHLFMFVTVGTFFINDFELVVMKYHIYKKIKLAFFVLKQ